MIMLWISLFLRFLMCDIILASVVLSSVTGISHGGSGVLTWFFVIAAIFVSLMHSTMQASKQLEQNRMREQLNAYGLYCKNCLHLAKTRFLGRLKCKAKKRTTEDNNCEKHSEFEEMQERHKQITEAARRQYDETITKGISGFSAIADSKVKISKKGSKIAAKVSDPMGELNALVGIERVKEEIGKLRALLWAHRQREKRNLKVSKPSLHMVFTGGPGTGKTTVARIVAGLYKDLGLLEKGHLIEVDRAGLVAGYLGQTSIKTKEVVDSAMGGVLFVDEAYSLAQGSLIGDQYGQECISVLLKCMEDYREDFAVIVAGYFNEMKQFIQSNPGLESRFRRYIHFADYSSSELVGIFEIMAKSRLYTYDESVIETVRKYFDDILSNTPANFSNARHVRNVLDMAEENMALRLQKKVAILNPDKLQKLEVQDVGFLRT
jgi:stage V sporulation protein K